MPRGVLDGAQLTAGIRGKHPVEVGRDDLGQSTKVFDAGVRCRRC